MSDSGNSENSTETQGRGIWPSRTAFILAAMGSAVGLGNVWRFPYYCYKYGGGAFLIPYFVALFTTGLPLMILEYSVGHKFRTSAPVAFAKMDKRFGWVGWFALTMSIVVITYYMVIMAWSVVYLGKSFTLDWGSNAEGHFLGSFLSVSSGPGSLGVMNWDILFGLVIIWAIVYLIIHKGVEQVGKVVMITVPLPFVLLIILAIKGLMLEGSMDGVEYYLKPDFSEMGNADVWLAAYGQIFFTLSLAQGVMIAYASYLPKESDIANNAHIVSFMDIGTSLLAGLAVFAVVGYLANEQGEAVSTVVREGGAGLAFIAYPTAIYKMGGFAEIIGILFFITLITLGIDSAFAMVEAMVAGLHDMGVDQKKSLLGTCLFGFFGGIIFTTGGGLYWLDIIDHYLNDFGLITVGILECIIVGHMFDPDVLLKHSNERSELKIGKNWLYSIKYITPIILSAILFVKFTELSEGYGGYESWALTVGAGMIPVTLAVSFYYSWRMSQNSELIEYSETDEESNISDTENPDKSQNSDMGYSDESLINERSENNESTEEEEKMKYLEHENETEEEVVQWED